VWFKIIDTIVWFKIIAPAVGQCQTTSEEVLVTRECWK